ncbi:unnamed protein product [Vitrella brassicaformis CCMP3155]|uniref:Inhibitor of growth protein n=2 Tax=Vitrella brassicaformis TaxID=1169539 RepID=A0A0G4FXF9_VITBC|nr:unnamed protein product [Vitrella brassicaformis CCMP3155]|eukprot:CEM19550.1 unnamed protein product [Vitrella brassicaformis CCMP3155]
MEPLDKNGMASGSTVCGAPPLYESDMSALPRSLPHNHIDNNGATEDGADRRGVIKWSPSEDDSPHENTSIASFRGGFFPDALEPPCGSFSVAGDPSDTVHEGVLVETLNSLQEIPALTKAKLFEIRELDERQTDLMRAVEALHKELHVQQHDRLKAKRGAAALPLIDSEMGEEDRGKLENLDEMKGQVREMADRKLHLVMEFYDHLDQKVKEMDDKYNPPAAEAPGGPSAAGLGAGGAHNAKHHRKRKHHIPKLIPKLLKKQKQEHSLGLEGSALGAEGEGKPTSADPLYCFCKSPSDGLMIACENEDCRFGEWFHFPCVGLRETDNPPTWTCPGCRKDPAWKKFWKTKAPAL